jgi:hypothetical protein
MTFSQAVERMGLYLAMEAFERNGQSETIPFSERVKTAEIVLSPDTRTNPHLSPNGDYWGETQVVEPLLRSAVTFEERLQTINVISSPGSAYRSHSSYSQQLLDLILKIGSQADSFQRCIDTLRVIKRTSHDTLPRTTDNWGLDNNKDENLAKIAQVLNSLSSLSVALPERAARFAQTQEEWRQLIDIAQTGDGLWLTAIKKLEELAVSLDHWLDFYGLVLRYTEDASLAERAVQKIAELVLKEPDEAAKTS